MKRLTAWDGRPVPYNICVCAKIWQIGRADIESAPYGNMVFVVYLRNKIITHYELRITH